MQSICKGRRMRRYLQGSLMVILGVLTCLVSGCQAPGHSGRSSGAEKTAAASGPYVPTSKGSGSSVKSAERPSEGDDAIFTCQRDLD
jgi:hypothetical protein